MYETPGRLTRPAPTLGADNALVYGDLGVTAADLARLASLGVI
jgi:crotonobetainyl-CoA:carnitine CoA-transferase CaiB-like acyl-CoA transferase